MTATQTVRPTTAHLSPYARVERVLGTRSMRIKGPIDLHERIVQGFPRRTMVNLVEGFTILKPDESFKALNVSARTWHRIKADKEQSTPLDADQSSRVWNLAEVLTKAEEVLGSRQDAEQWLATPATGLDSHRPIELMATAQGAELVKTLLDQMAYGVYA
jgi:putative toxin-antitoxin system antitoxin component (TIGR02293 family)